MRALLSGVLHSFDFRGRLGRRDYWVLVIGLLLLNGVVFAILQSPPTDRNRAAIAAALSMLTTVSLLSATIRRLRDTGRRWFSLLIAVVPVIGALALLWWLCGKSGDETPNANGETGFGETFRAWSVRGTKLDNAEAEAVRERHGGVFERMLKSREIRMAERAVLTNVIACPQCGTSTSYPSSVDTRRHSCPHCNTTFHARYHDDGSLMDCWR